MSDVQFEGEQYIQTQSYAPLPQEKGMIGFLIKKGWAKDTTQANYILLTILVVVVIAIFFVLRSGNSSPTELPPELINPEPIPGEEFNF